MTDLEAAFLGSLLVLHVFLLAFRVSQRAYIVIFGGYMIVWSGILTLARG